MPHRLIYKRSKHWPYVLQYEQKIGLLDSL